MKIDTFAWWTFAVGLFGGTLVTLKICKWYVVRQAARRAARGRDV
jgi:uncharacterized membrane protein YdcZ (DUF606 family)